MVTEFRASHLYGCRSGTHSKIALRFYGTERPTGYRAVSLPIVIGLISPLSNLWEDSLVQTSLYHRFEHPGSLFNDYFENPVFHPDLGPSLRFPSFQRRNFSERN